METVESALTGPIEPVVSMRVFAGRWGRDESGIVYRGLLFVDPLPRDACFLSIQPAASGRTEDYRVMSSYS